MRWQEVRGFLCSAMKLELPISEPMRRKKHTLTDHPRLWMSVARCRYVLQCRIPAESRAAAEALTEGVSGSRGPPHIATICLPAALTNSATSRLAATASLVAAPCRQAPLAFPIGAPALAPCIRHTRQPFTAGARQRHRERLPIWRGVRGALVRDRRDGGPVDHPGRAHEGEDSATGAAAAALCGDPGRGSVSRIDFGPLVPERVRRAAQRHDVDQGLARLRVGRRGNCSRVQVGLQELVRGGGQGRLRQLRSLTVGRGQQRPSCDTDDQTFCAPRAHKSVAVASSIAAVDHAVGRSRLLANALDLMPQPMAVPTAREGQSLLTSTALLRPSAR